MERPQKRYFYPKTSPKTLLFKGDHHEKTGLFAPIYIFTPFFPAEKSADIEACLLFPEKYYPLFD